MYKKKQGAIISSVVMIAVVVLWLALFLILSIGDHMPIPFLLLMILPPVIVVIGILLALRERMKEIEKGEEDEATHY